MHIVVVKSAPNNTTIVMAVASQHAFKAFRHINGEYRSAVDPHGISYSVGETYTVAGVVQMCRNGYHACVLPANCFDTVIRYRYGYGYDRDVLGEVLLSGDMVADDEKTVARSFTLLRILTQEEQDDVCAVRTAGAVEYGGQRWHADGEEWLADGRRHRGGDLPAVTHSDGGQEWWTRNKRHRGGDLPAVAHADGGQEWWVHGKRHRDNDLPAVVHGNGKKVQSTCAGYYFQHVAS